MQLQLEIKTSFATKLNVGDIYFVKDIMELHTGYYKVDKTEPDKIVLVNWESNTSLILRPDRYTISRYELTEAKIVYGTSGINGEEKCNVGVARAKYECQ